MVVCSNRVSPSQTRLPRTVLHSALRAIVTNKCLRQVFVEFATVAIPLKMLFELGKLGETQNGNDALKYLFPYCSGSGSGYVLTMQCKKWLWQW